MWKIGSVDIANPVVIAPMAGVSNPAFRSIARQFHAGLIYSEMISDKAICYNNQKTLKMTEAEENDHPLTMQLFGSELDSMVKAAMFMDTQTSCDIIDINMGCPVSKIIKTGAGSALMQTPDQAYQIVKEIVKAVAKPVTVKIRTGFDSQSINCIEMAKGLEAAGAAALAVHGRTRSQMYDGKADWSWIQNVKQAVSIPVMGNGDIKSAEEALRRMKETGVDAIMVGRGILGDPWLIQEMVSAFKQGTITEKPSLHEKLSLALDHAQRLCDLKGEGVGMKEMRGHALWYMAGLHHSARMKDAMSRMTSLSQFHFLLSRYEQIMAMPEELWKEEIEKLVLPFLLD